MPLTWAPRAAGDLAPTCPQDPPSVRPARRWYLARRAPKAPPPSVRPARRWYLAPTCPKTRALCAPARRWGLARRAPKAPRPLCAPPAAGGLARRGPKAPRLCVGTGPDLARVPGSLPTPMGVKKIGAIYSAPRTKRSLPYVSHTRVHQIWASSHISPYS